MFDRMSSTFNYFSGLNPERRRLIESLHRAIADDGNLSALFGVKGDLLDEVIVANLEVMTSPVMSALDRYGPGVMYKAMDFNNLPTGAQRRLLEHGVIFSGLFGLIRPDDLIPFYRLRMDATLDVGKVSTYWRPFLSPVLNELVTDRFVWNLLSSVHQDAWADEHTYRGLIQVKFYKNIDGQRKPVTHGVKPLRGALVNFIVRESAESLDALSDLDLKGYRFDPEASTWDAATRNGMAVMVA